MYDLATLEVCRRGDTWNEPLSGRVETIIFRGVDAGGGGDCVAPREKFKLQNLVEKLKEAPYISTPLTEKTCYNSPGQVIIPPPTP